MMEHMSSSELDSLQIQEGNQNIFPSTHSLPKWEARVWNDTPTLGMVAKN